MIPERIIFVSRGITVAHSHVPKFSVIWHTNMRTMGVSNTQLSIVTTELIEYPTALYSFSKFSINPWITEPKKKLPTLTELDTYFTHIF